MLAPLPVDYYAKASYLGNDWDTQSYYRSVLCLKDYQDQECEHLFILFSCFSHTLKNPGFKPPE